MWRNRLRVIRIVFVLRFLLLFLCLSAALPALEPDKRITQYNVQVWDIKAGLPGNTVFAIRQSRDGYLWIGTQDGLVRFDGVNFESYNRGKIPGLQGNVIRALHEDRNGNLWIGTASEGLICFKDGQFTNYPAATYKALFRIKAINEDKRGNLWIGSLTRGLTCLSKGEFTTYTTKEGFPGNQVRFIYKDDNGDLWVAVSTAVVRVLKPGVFQNYAPQEELPYLKTACLYEAESESLWIGSGEKGLFRLRNGVYTAYESTGGIPHPTINCLYKDRMNNLWIGTDGGGISRMKDGEFESLPGEDGLASGFVYAIAEDREGSLWVGTLDGGLHQIRDGKFTTYTTREGLCHDNIFCICEGRAGDLWIGSEGGLSRIKKGAITTPLTPGVDLSNTLVPSVFEDSSGCLWIGTWAGVHRYKDGRLSTFTTKDGLSDNRIRSIVEDRQGNIWIGSENGLNRFDRPSGRFSIFGTGQGLLSNAVKFLFPDRGGNLWIGSDSGLNTWRNGIITAFDPGVDIEDKNFNCAYEDRAGVLWFGSESGLIRLDSKKTTLYTSQCGLSENRIYSVLEDENGYLWLAGWNGISRVRKKELADFAEGKINRVYPDSYNEKHGLKSLWCTGLGCKTQDGILWFPTTIGISKIDPNRIRKNNLPPPIIIEKIVADGETIKIRNFSPYLPEIAAGKKRLEFYYTAASFINPQDIKFKIKLQGYDRDWVVRGSRRSSSYTGLSPGTYTFKVTACNSDGVWNETGSSLSFYLKPYWYQTRWAYLVFGLSLLLAVVSFIRWRSWKLVREKQVLERIVKERTREIKNKNIQLKEQSEKLKEMDKVKSRFFANISHEFRTPLTLIMGPLEQMFEESTKKEQQQKINMMLRNSRRLLGLINQLLDLSKLESGRMKLSAARQNVVPFLKGIVDSFDSLTTQNELELKFYSEVEDIILFYDGEKLEKMICNLLINAIKFTPPGGTITVTVTLHGNDKMNQKFFGQINYPSGYVQISVKDTGIGIPAEQLEHIFDRFYQAEGIKEHAHKGSGIGLALTKELVALHHGEIRVHSEEGKGSEFIITLPLGDAHLKPEDQGALFEKTAPWTPAKTFIDLQEDVPAVEESEPGPGEYPGKEEKNIILLVEDNADVRSYIRGAIEAHYRVAEARDGVKGVKKALEIIPDLIISDIMMPGMDGYELCRVLKKDVKTSHIPIILLTAKADEENIIKGLETGADDYITKPFNSKILLARIRNLIDIRGQLQENLRREMTFQPVKTSVSNVDKDFLKELQAVLEKNIADPDFNVDQLSKKLYMSHTNLYRKIHALTGESPTDFLQSFRLKKGAELLKSNFGSVLEVALEVGFSSAGYFSKCFKKKFHQLPTDYQSARAD